MSSEDLIIYEDKVYLVEQSVEREVPLDKYITKLGTSVCHGTLRLPANCITYKMRRHGGTYLANVVVSVPPRKRTLVHNVVKEEIGIVDGESILIRKEEPIPNLVLLPPLVFVVSFYLHEETKRVTGFRHLYLYAVLSTDLVDGKTSLRRAQLANVNDDARICFGEVPVDERVQDKKLLEAVDQVIDAYFSTVGNDDYHFHRPFDSFENWVEQSAKSEEAVLEEHDRIYRQRSPMTCLEQVYNNYD